MGDEMVKVEQYGNNVEATYATHSIAITFEDPTEIGLFSEQHASEIVLEMPRDIGQELLGQLLVIYKPDMVAAHVVNMATALRTLTKLVDGEMHSIGHIGGYLKECMACHALVESNATAVLQDHDDAWKVKA